MTPLDPLDDADLWDGWVLPRPTAKALVARLRVRAPRLVLEAGSGVSTLILAGYARDHDATVVSLEHDPRYARQTAKLLDRHGLGGVVTLCLAPLRRHPSGRGPWYACPLPDGIEFAIIDGPPKSVGGRAAALPALLPHLARVWELWMDDGNRKSEKDAAAAWARDHGVHVEHVPIGRGIIRVTS
jgi:hypothetical protein